jgi:hypothetical protein
LPPHKPGSILSRIKRPALFQNQLLWLLFLVIVFVHCEVENCVSLNTNLLQVGFVKSDVRFSNDYHFNLVTAVETDTIFYEDAVLQRLELPVNPNSEETEFLLEITRFRLDTIPQLPPAEDRIDTVFIGPENHFIKVNYKITQKVITTECGVDQRYSNLTFEHSFDSIEVVNTDLDRFNEVNINIIY